MTPVSSAPNAIDAIVDLFERRIGVRIDEPDKERIRRHAASKQLSVEALVDRLRGESAGGEEFEALVEAVANGQTFFCRDRRMLQLLIRRYRANPRPCLRVWSAGCSTGEEAYSIALACWLEGVRVEVVGSDVSAAAIRVAEEGVYDAWRLRRLEADEIERHFEPAGGDRMRVRDHLRRSVRFVQHNLVRSPPLDSQEGWDAIVCQNVFIYYRSETIREAVGRLTRGLRLGGTLILGASELLPKGRFPLTPLLLGGRLAYEKSGTSKRLSKAPRRLSTLPPPPDGTALLDALHARVLRATKSGAPQSKETVASLSAMLDADPDASDALALMTVGNLHLSEHRFEEAEAAYRRAQAAAPLDPGPAYLLGLAALKQLRAEEAETCFRRSLFLSPRFWPAAYHLGAVYERLGLRDMAERALVRTMALLNEDVHERVLQPVDGLAHGYLEPEMARRACETRLTHLGRRLFQ